MDLKKIALVDTVLYILKLETKSKHLYFIIDHLCVNIILFAMKNVCKQSITMVINQSDAYFSEQWPLPDIVN